MTGGQPVAREHVGRRDRRRSRALWRAAHVVSERCGGSSARNAADRLRRHRRRPVGWRPSRGRSRTWPTRLSRRRSQLGPPRARSNDSASPATPAGGEARFVVLAPGQAGRHGTELLQRHRPDLPLRRRRPDRRRAARSRNQEFFDRLARELVELLTEPTELGVAYRVDLRLRPEGARGPVAMQRRTRRCTTTTSRAAPGSGRPTSRPGRSPATCDLGREFLDAARAVDLSPLSRAGPTSPASRRSSAGSSSGRSCEATDDRNVKTGHGGIRDIEFVIQFLQLLNGGDLPDMRTGNTLEAIAQLRTGRLPDRPGARRCWRRTTPSSARSNIGCRSCSTCRRINLPETDEETRKAGDADGVRDAIEAAGRWRRFERDYQRTNRSRTARSSITCCTTPSATTSDRAGGRSGPRPRSVRRDRSRSVLGPYAFPRHAGGLSRI